MMNIYFRPAFLIYLFCFQMVLIAQIDVLDNEWVTKFERSNYLETSDYDETINFFMNLEKNSSYAKMIKFGTSPQGREMYVLVVSKDKEFHASAAKSSGKPIVLVQNGIHAGEIEGKDASMLMLREMLISKEKESLLDNLILMVIPVLSVDGHERVSRYNRINQNGPLEMGWRTTAQNLNLNRDYLKADAPEMKALLSLFSQWLPDFYIDTHTTDGADYQYDITYLVSNHINVSPMMREFIDNKFIPFFTKKVEDDGFLPGPFIWFKDEDKSKGLLDWIPEGRFSNGYAELQNRFGLLIETHMLKPYKDRVFSTKSLVEASLAFISINSKEVKQIVADSDNYKMKKYLPGSYFPLAYELTNEADSIVYKGIKEEYIESPITGTKIVRYLSEPYSMKIPFYNNFVIRDSLKIPDGYLIPAEWSFFIDILKLHGVTIKNFPDGNDFEYEKYKFKDVEFNKTPYEGRQNVRCAYDVVKFDQEIPACSYFIDVRQRAAGVIISLLEPASDESFLKWGFFNTIFERKEYFEDYSMEPIARKMYEEDENLRNEFLQKIETDEKFKNNPYARLNFFFERSPYFDSKLREYPIIRVIKKR